MTKIQKKRVTGSYWHGDSDIKFMREPFSKVFYDEWKRGFDAYQKG